jgi:hypothetical protein
MTKPFYCLAVFLCALCLSGGSQNSSHAAGDQGIVATVNDVPITSFDIDQRLRLLEILGNKQEGASGRKKALPKPRSTKLMPRTSSLKNSCGALQKV